MGVMAKSAAQYIADMRDLDLVNISPAARPPVCKIMNYGKYRFDMKKKEKETRKAQKIADIKEIQFSQAIDTADMQVRARQARSFLLDGNKVKVLLKMRSRQKCHPEISFKVLDVFFGMLEDVAVVDKKPVVGERNIFLILAPKK